MSKVFKGVAGFLAPAAFGLLVIVAQRVFGGAKRQWLVTVEHGEGDMTTRVFPGGAWMAASAWGQGVAAAHPGWTFDITATDQPPTEDGRTWTLFERLEENDRLAALHAGGGQ